ncbi:SRPBCC family protein [Streptomyces sp. NPDC004959]|uniref:SRPBCC family protein n=1 Tax=unclassified Streptomyces TaxID=2593676 RepID=UPI0004CB9D92|nr:SRPBCC family protein [Streptomyces sp. NRRL F-5630]
MRPYHYRFRSRWLLPAEPRRVYAVLARPEEYPRWWPQVRSARTADDGRSGSARIRSVLPYDLRVTIRELPGPSEAPGPDGVGVLRAAVDGDIRGEVGWRLSPWGAGTLAEFEQRVEVVTPLLRLLSLPGRPLLRLNHLLMMRAGQRALRALLTRADEGARGSGEAV